jgi:hypothetical protein
MKIIIIVLSILFTSFGAFSQTAANFTCNDCAGASHTLFDELDAGKVVVLCWVMPCSTCIGPSKTTYNVVQSFALSYPDRVKMYVCDDYANTTCSSLISWCNQNALTNTTKFSDADINPANYGTVGMPKIVVVGNYTHHVYYNANNSVNPTLLSDAISAALTDFSVGMEELADKPDEIISYPNPAADQISFNFAAEKSGTGMLTIFNTAFGKVSEPQSYTIKQGDNNLKLNTANLKNGIYFAHLQTDTGVMKTKFVVSH